MAGVSSEKIDFIRDRLLPWFQRSRRDLPWRRTKDPYRIWLSEVMLQQTRVTQAESYYSRFVERYPTVDRLASADLDTILRDWEGLGYYARARHMHRAARMIVREMQGEFPDRHEDVLSLPGVGRYTAAAVMSIAFDQPFAAVDGNVIRVISRLFGISDDPSTSAGKRRFQQIADELLDDTNPGTFNEAMMELGATVCVPKGPACDQCPVAGACAAFEHGSTGELPFRRARREVPHYEIAVAVVFDSENRVLIQRRREDGLLGGLWEFPGGKIEGGESARQACCREVLEELGVTIDVREPLEEVDHAYSHFTVRLHPFVCGLRGGRVRTELPWRWVALGDLVDYGFPRANRRIIDALMAAREAGSGRLRGGGVHS